MVRFREPLQNWMKIFMRHNGRTLVIRLQLPKMAIDLWHLDRIRTHEIFKCIFFQVSTGDHYFMPWRRRDCNAIEKSSLSHVDYFASPDWTNIWAIASHSFTLHSNGDSVKKNMNSTTKESQQQAIADHHTVQLRRTQQLLLVWLVSLVLIRIFGAFLIEHWDEKRANPEAQSQTAMKFNFCAGVLLGDAIHREWNPGWQIECG